MRMGQLVRTDPVVLLAETVQQGRPVIAFTDGALEPSHTFVTGIGAGTTYPDYKPAPFIVGQRT